MVRRLLSCLGLGLLSLTIPAAAWAQASLPSLSGIDEIQVQPARIGSKPTSETCHYSSGEVSAVIQKLLKGDGLPAFSILETQEVKPGRTRIELLPEVVTLLSSSQECLSWVSLTAQTRTSISVPPVETPRNVTITYWRGGLMVGSAQTAHPKMLYEAASKLAAAFSRQYQIDQPPSLTPTSAPPASAR